MLPNRTITASAFLSAAALLGRILGAARALVLARLWAPPEYGVWLTLMTIPSYAPIACLGSVEALLKQLPQFLGRRDESAAAHIESHVLGAVLLSSFALLLLGLPAAFFLEGVAGLPFWALSCFVLASALGFCSAYLSHRCAAYEKFELLSLLESFRSIAAFAFVVVGAYFSFNLACLGYLIHEICICCIAAILNWKQFNFPVPRFSFNDFRAVIRVGLPITFIWWLFVLQTSLDRVMTISLYGKTQAGLFGFAASIAFAFLLIPQALSRVAYPEIARTAGAGDFRSLRKAALGPVNVLSLLMPTLLGISLFLVEPGINRFFPKYSSGVTSAQLLLFNCFFLSILRLGTNVLVSLDMERFLLRASLFCLLLNGVGNIAAYYLLPGTVGVCLSTLTSTAVLCVVLWGRALRLLKMVRSECWAVMAQIFLPITFVMTVFWLSQAAPALPGLSKNLQNFLIFAVLTGPSILIYYPYWRKASLVELQSA